MQWAALMRDFHLEVARFDRSGSCEDSGGEAPNSLPTFEKSINDASLVSSFDFVLDSLLQEAAISGQPSSFWTVEPRASQDAEASEKRFVSYIELYVALRYFLGSGRTLLEIAHRSATMMQLAADFRFFKGILKEICLKAGVEQFSDCMNLASVFIFVPQPDLAIGWPAATETHCSSCAVFSPADLLGMHRLCQDPGVPREWTRLGLAATAALRLASPVRKI